MTSHEGGCLCGAVRFSVAGDPVVAGACYCRDCQYASGGGPAYGMVYPVEAVTVTRGETRAFAVKGQSGNEVYRHFCPACGVQLFGHNSAQPEFKSVKIGVLDDPGWFRAQGSIWTASAQPWHWIDPGLPSARQNPR